MSRTRKRANSPEDAFARVLKVVRQERGLSQEELGFESNCHRTYISQLERGLKSPSLSTLFRLAAALDISPSELVKRVESGGEAA